MKTPQLLALSLCPVFLLAGAAIAQTTPTAEYEVVFDSSWSADTHPQDFPPNPHFSALVGGTHGDQVVFWSPGGLATEGIERMAEGGATSPLREEIQAAIDAGTAGEVFTGGGIGTSPGSARVSLTAHEDFPLLTLVSMLAPSPDWFVGVHGLSLVENGEWVDQLILPLNVYDAGTDSAPSYVHANTDTDPPDPISRFDTGLFSPPAATVGTFSITRTDAPPAPVPSMSRLLLPALLITPLVTVLLLGRRRQHQP